MATARSQIGDGNGQEQADDRNHYHHLDESEPTITGALPARARQI